MDLKPIPYGRQTILDEDVAAVVNVLKSDFLTQGPVVEQFEKAFAAYVGAKHAIAVTNGTAGLHLSAIALGVESGQTILTTPNTFVASANCIRYCGGELEFVDIDTQNFSLSLDLLEKRLRAFPNRYAGAVYVDFAGYPGDMLRLREIADRYGIWIIEDACHAVGAHRTLNKQRVFAGSGVADLSVFSFHPVKHIAMGEGGMITTNSDSLAAKVKLLRTHGITKDEALFQSKPDGPWYYEMQELGYNYRVSDILCALGLAQLGRIESNLKRRQVIAHAYMSQLEDLPLELPHQPDGIFHAFHLFVIQSEERDRLYAHLKANGINPQVLYIPVYRHPYYRRRYNIELETAEKYYSQSLALPMYHGLSDDQVSFVIRIIRDFFKSR